MEQVGFAYQETPPVLEGLDFRLEEGDFLVVFGANGAGKTTLCYLLSGVIPHIWAGTRRGEVSVCGLDPWSVPMHRLASHVGIVLQDPEAQLAMPNVRLELAFGPANLGLPREEIFARIPQALAAVGLEGFEARGTAALSGGQKQRVALASALMLAPRLLILDEPTSQLDPLGNAEVLEALRRIQGREGLTVLMTTHNTQDILDLGLGTAALVLDRGRVAAWGPVDEVLAQVELLERVGVHPPPLQKIWAAVAPDLNGRAEAAASVACLAAAIRGGLEAGRLRVREIARPGEDGGGAGAAGAAEPPLLEVDGLSFAYPGDPPVQALRDVDLTVRAGEFVGLIGQNGSGKSTLVRCLVGVLRPQQGAVRFRGKDIARFRVGQLSTRIGLVLQNPDYQLFSISAEEEVLFGLRNLGVPPEEAARRTRAALAEVGLGEVRDVFPFRLSFGDRRKLAVASVLAMGPELLILDEPTTAQDYHGRYLLAELAERLRAAGKTILMITHDMDLIARYARRLVVMRDGEVVLDGPTRDVFAEGEVLAATKLRAPLAFRLGQELGVWEPLPLTVDDVLAGLGPAG